MRAVVVHNVPETIPHNALRPDQLDTLVQAQAVHAALESLGAQPVMLSMSLDLDAARSTLMQLAPDIIFNLVEELAGDIRLAPLAPALFGHMHLPCTGTDAQGLTLSGDKVLCKRILGAAGIATPAWVLPDGTFGGMGAAFMPGTYLCKSVHEHASLGLDDSCLVTADTVDAVVTRLAECAARHGGQWFAEAYVDGREFNIAIIAGEAGAEPDVLPFAEIVFRDFGPDRPRIVGYAAKWDESAFEYANTVRNFEFGADEAPLLDALHDATAACWKAFGLAGYARIDFRVAGNGTPEAPFVPMVIDVNANPCIAPDAGLAAAAQRSGLTYEQLVRRVVQAALHSAGAALSMHPGRPATGCL